MSDSPKIRLMCSILWRTPIDAVTDDPPEIGADSPRRAAMDAATEDAPTHRADRPRRHAIDTMTLDVPTHRADSSTGGGCTRCGARTGIVIRGVTRQVIVVGRQVMGGPRNRKAPVKGLGVWVCGAG